MRSVCYYCRPCLLLVILLISGQPQASTGLVWWTIRPLFLGININASRIRRTYCSSSSSSSAPVLISKNHNHNHDERTLSLPSSSIPQCQIVLDNNTKGHRPHLILDNRSSLFYNSRKQLYQETPPLAAASTRSETSKRTNSVLIYRRAIFGVPIFCGSLLLRKNVAVAATAAAATATMSAAPAATVRWSGLLVSSSMVLAVTLTMRVLGLKRLSTQFVRATGRMSIQLFLVGAVLLDHIFGTHYPWMVGGWLMCMGAMASREAASRINPHYAYPRMQRHCAIATVAGVGTSLAVTALFVLPNIPNQPWWGTPRSIIPIAGMLFGNSLSAISLGMNALLKEFSVGEGVGRSRIERRLAHGATYWEASVEVARHAMATALTPTISAMASTVSHAVIQYVDGSQDIKYETMSHILRIHGSIGIYT
jgi:ABC-type iron transport system FetAB permease component